MVQLSFLILYLFWVQKIEVGPTSAMIFLADGQKGILLRSNPFYSTYLGLADQSKKEHVPVGIGLNSNHEITAVQTAQWGTPERIKESKDGMEVYFQNQKEPFVLISQHPNYERLGLTVGSAIKDNKALWYIAKFPERILLDTRPR